MHLNEDKYAGCLGFEDWLLYIGLTIAFGVFK